MPANLGQQKQYFERLFKNGSLGHAYLLVGQDAIGKRVFVDEICTMITGREVGNNPDIKQLNLDKEKDIYKIHIADVRGLKSFMSLKPHSSEYKIAIVDDADAMTAEAANAMLKILEEPPKKSVIILVSSKPRTLPQTILSRCETVVFAPPAEVQTDEMAKALTELRKVVRQSMAERIKYAKALYEKEDYASLVNLWLRSLRLQLINKPTTAPILRKLLRLSHIVSQPQFNHRIALENFLVRL